MSSTISIAMPSFRGPGTHLFPDRKGDLQNICWDDLWTAALELRRGGVTTYAHIIVKGCPLEDEVEKLSSLKSLVDYFVFEPMTWLSEDGDLSCELWQRTVDYTTARFGQFVGLRIEQENLPEEVMLPWLTKTAIFAKKPVLLFLEGKIALLLRQIHDQLKANLLSQDAASFVPIYAPSHIDVGSLRYGCVDFSEVDELLTQMKRSSCKKVVVEEQSVLNKLSFSEVLRRAIEKNISSLSVLESWEEGFSWCPSFYRGRIILAFYSLVRALKNTTQSVQELPSLKNSLEKAVEDMRFRNTFCTDEHYLQFLEQTKAVLLSADQVITSSKPVRRLYSWRD
jgi:hypothetical protein